jgi:hypothetical protein
VRQHHDGNGQHGIHQARPQDGDDDDGQQQAGQGQNDVHQAHHGDFVHAPEIPGGQA